MSRCGPCAGGVRHSHPSLRPTLDNPAEIGLGPRPPWSPPDLSSDGESLSPKVRISKPASPKSEVLVPRHEYAGGAPERRLGDHVFPIARSLVVLQCPLAYVVLRTGVAQ